MVVFALSLVLKLVLSAFMSAYLGLGTLWWARAVGPGLWAFKGGRMASLLRVSGTVSSCPACGGVPLWSVTCRTARSYTAF